MNRFVTNLFNNEYHMDGVKLRTTQTMIKVMNDNYLVLSCHFFHSWNLWIDLAAECGGHSHVLNPIKHWTVKMIMT